MRLVVVDNNPEPTARPIVDELAAGMAGAAYVHCAEPGIPVARNAALAAALREGADYIAFLDDDEVAPEHWLASLMAILQASGADAVQGGVRRCRLDSGADLAARPSGLPAWESSETLATCNVLLRAALVQPPVSLRFDESMRFTGGSDREFFMRAGQRGAKLVRAHGAEVLEDIHAERQFLGYQAARAFASGSNFFERVVKNEPPAVAAARIAARALDRSVTGLAKMIAAAALLAALRRRSALEQWRKACVSLCFAAGCLTPVAGVRAYPYREIQGA